MAAIRLRSTGGRFDKNSRVDHPEVETRINLTRKAKAALALGHFDTRIQRLGSRVDEKREVRAGKCGPNRRDANGDRRVRWDL